MRKQSERRQQRSRRVAAAASIARGQSMSLAAAAYGRKLHSLRSVTRSVTQTTHTHASKHKERPSAKCAASAFTPAQHTSRSRAQSASLLLAR